MQRPLSRRIVFAANWWPDPLTRFFDQLLSLLGHGLSLALRSAPFREKLPEPVLSGANLSSIAALRKLP